MTPPQWGIPILLALGVAVIVCGWWWDRRRYRMLGDGFTTEADLVGLEPPRAATTGLDALLAGRSGNATIPGGLADPAFLTHRAEGVAVAENALVLVTDADLDDDRLLVDALADAQRDARPLVIVAPRFGFDLLGTLRANLLTGRVAVVPIELADPGLLARTVDLCGGAVIPDADLRSGWMPPEVWGSAATWVADLNDSWVDPRA
ncbi:MAG: hypothetical protein IPL36_01360 [Nigerium sp.]|nr:hypothetical protein [Nigerium sp.]